MAELTRVKIRLKNDAGAVQSGMTFPALGSAAIRQHTDFLQTALNLSDLPDKPAARANLGLGSAATKDVSYFTFIGRPDTPPNYATPVPYVGGAIVRVNNGGANVRFADNVRIESGHLHVNFNPGDLASLQAASIKGVITAWDGLGAIQWRVDATGATYANGAYSASGADYAERFESLSGAAIPPGTTVVLDAGKVRPALVTDAPDDIIGAIRPEGTSALVGNDSSFVWKDKYLTDAYGTSQTVDVPVWRWYSDALERYQYADADGPDRPNGVPESAILTVRVDRVANPAFDPEIPYVPRSQRPEWVVVGLLGQIPVANGQPVNPRWRQMGAGPVAGMWLVR